MPYNSLHPFVYWFAASYVLAVTLSSGAVALACVFHEPVAATMAPWQTDRLIEWATHNLQRNKGIADLFLTLF
jgi:hypothetical protein